MQVQQQAFYLDQLAAEYEARGYRVRFMPFTYSANWAPLLSDTLQSQKVTIDHDSDFVCTALTRAVFDTAVPPIYDTNPSILARFILGTARKRLDDAGQLLSNVWGVGGRPGWLPKPLVLPAKTTVEIELESINANPDSTIFLSLLGVKVFLSGA